MTTPQETAQYFEGKPYGRLLVPESDGGYSAEIVEFPGCIAEGDTAEEAVANVESTATAWIESELEQGHKIPAPVCGEEYSGRLALRLPRSFHRALAIKAARDRTSINQQVVSAVATWIGADDTYQRLAERFSQQVTVRSSLWLDAPKRYVLAGSYGVIFESVSWVKGSRAPVELLGTLASMTSGGTADTAGAPTVRTAGPQWERERV